MKAKKLGALLSPLLCAAFALGMAACGDNPSDSSSGGSHGNKGYYTYNTYMAGTNNLNWNPHTWETNDDSGLLGYMSMGFFDFVLAENKTSNARVPEMAAYVPGTQNCMRTSPLLMRAATAWAREKPPKHSASI